MAIKRPFTPARRTRFIEMLARTVGVSRPHVYWLRARDADFARRWKEALEGERG